MPATSVSDKLLSVAPLWTGTIGPGGVPDDSTQTIPLSSATGLTNGEAYVFTIDRVNSAGTRTPPLKETCVGKLSGTNFINTVRGVEGTAQEHAANAVVEILFTAAHWEKLVEWAEVEHNQDGTHKDTILALLAGNQTFTGEKTFGSGKLKATRPQVTTSIDDSNGNEIIKTPATSSAVNEITITNAATGNGPDISATGDDTNIDLTLTAKGTGVVKAMGERVIVSEDDKNYFQSGDVTTDTSWTQDTNTQVYSNTVAVTFPTAFKAGTTPRVVATVDGSTIQSGTFVQVTGVSNTGCTLIVSITHLNINGTATKVFWMAHGEK